MADGAAVEALRQQGQERREIRAFERLEGRQLPQHRPELVLELQDAAAEEALDRGPGLRQHAAMGGKARPLEREHEIIRRLRRPAPEALRLLAAVEGAVDLDGGDGAAGMLELARLRQLLRIERAAPGLEHPPPDADPDHGVRPAAEAICTLARRGRSPGSSL